ncbi:MAG: aminoglycoside phosphotransferase family protein [Anaerolineaceae bacterium]|nr:aminoglycoside phosphotransferase family protein [Anaerolineaceae bacterium]
MEIIPDPIDEILEVCGISGPWESMDATGVANRIYATKDVVIRVAREHAEALHDARTESIAAPVAYEAGLLTPRLLVFDESGDLLDRPYSIWERVHGETLGLISSDPHSMPNTWRQVGHQMARLHVNVEPFDDPKKYLHEPGRDLQIETLLEKLVSAGHFHKDHVREISTLITELQPAVLEESKICFLHSDVKDMNIMCTQDDELLALIDWGDAGWGDPTFDFAQIPLRAIPYVLEGYGNEASDLLGGTLKERIIWDKLYYALEKSIEKSSSDIPLGEFRQFLNKI